ncbi:hypothetical protein BDP27DRAFT_1502812 [Rhodocollybia butyracea]|uniref:Uncharacterized protein n=1 Tax=Rhodocollybia butyracea TaxID=206335 RepID=A0A9P5U9S3_9AGAR|nr:hypothetical protein BDP27DRAFT_1502812 [Rhodocollybia butyracea]
MASSPTHIQNVSYSHLQTSDDTPDCLSSGNSPLPLHVGTKGTTMGYFTILSCYIGAGVVAVINHIVFSEIKETIMGNHTKQFWVSLLQNIFPTAVALLLFASLKTCLSQAALYRLRSDTHSVALVSLITSPPGFLTTLKILLKSSLRHRILEWVILSGMAQAIAVTSIFVPGSLTIVSNPAQSTLLETSTIDLNTVSPTSSTANSVKLVLSDGTQKLIFGGPSPRWNRLLQQSLLSDNAPTWDTPAGEEIWPNNNASSNSSLLGFPFLLDNPDNPSLPIQEFTIYLSSSGFDKFSPTFDLYYIEGFNSTYYLMAGPGLNLSNYHPQGVHCGFQTATYEATTFISQGGQVSTTRVIEWSDSFPSGESGSEPLLGTNVTNVTMALLSIASVYVQVLNGSLTFDGFPEILPIQALNTPLFNITSTTSFGSSPGFLLSLSSDVGNLADGLQSLLGNSTLALVGEGIATTWVNATVVPDSLQYQYHPGKLALIYGIVFGVALLVVIDGLICLRANGTAANFDFQGIVEMTANSHGLHELAGLPEFADVPVRGTLGLSSSSTARPVLNSDWERKK